MLAVLWGALILTAGACALAFAALIVMSLAYGIRQIAVGRSAQEFAEGGGSILLGIILCAAAYFIYYNISGENNVQMQIQAERAEEKRQGAEWERYIGQECVIGEYYYLQTHGASIRAWDIYENKSVNITGWGGEYGGLNEKPYAMLDYRSYRDNEQPKYTCLLKSSSDHYYIVDTKYLRLIDRASRIKSEMANAARQDCLNGRLYYIQTYGEEIEVIDRRTPDHRKFNISGSGEQSDVSYRVRDYYFFRGYEREHPRNMCLVVEESEDGARFLMDKKYLRLADPNRR